MDAEGALLLELVPPVAPGLHGPREVPDAAGRHPQRAVRGQGDQGDHGALALRARRRVGRSCGRGSALRATCCRAFILWSCNSIYKIKESCLLPELIVLWHYQIQHFPSNRRRLARQSKLRF